MGLVLHPRTQHAVDTAVASGAHAIILMGNQGAGKRTTAHYLASQVLGIDMKRAPYSLTVQPDGKAIGIEQIRELQKFLQLKTTGQGAIRRVALILEADTMTIEAQNALLKVLEEPPEDTVLILTATKSHQLRPTIHSRVQAITVMPPAKAIVLNYFLNKGHSGTDIERTYMLSNGQIGLMTALLETPGESDLAGHITTAKGLYGMSAFERLTKVDELSKDRDAITNLLFACKRICITALEQAAFKGQDKVVRTWHKQLSLIVQAEESLKYTPNTKLLLTDLFIQM